MGFLALLLLTACNKREADLGLAAQSLRSTEELFERPLIVGASISADHSAVSPGKRLALRYTSPESLRSLARGGARARSLLPQLSDEMLVDRSVVVGVDLLFWDSTDFNCTPSIEAFRELHARTEARGLPLVVGDVPELLAGRQPCRAALNEALRETCDGPTSCRILGLEAIYAQLSSAEGVVIGGRTYRFRDFVPDGLHVNDQGSDYLAEKLLTLVDGL